MTSQEDGQIHTKKTVFRWFISYVKPYRLWVFLSIIASLMVAGIEVGMGVLIKRMVEHATDFTYLLELTGIIIVVTIVGFFSKYLIRYSVARFSSYALRDLKNSLAFHMEKLPVSTMEKFHSGDLVSRLTNDTAVLFQFFQQHFFQMFYMPVVFLGALTFLLYTNWKLILFSVALLPIAAILMGILSRPLQTFAEQIQGELGKSNAIAQDLISGIHIAKSFHLREILFDKYKENLQRVLNIGLHYEKRQALIVGPSLLLFTSPVLFFVAYGGYLIKTGELDVSSLVVFSYLLGFIIEPLSLVPVLYAQIQETSGAANRLYELYRLPPEEERKSTFPFLADAIPITFDNVSFSYEGKKKILDGISFEVPANHTIALVGASGSGKSTILKLLCGFYQVQPGHGKIKLFGHAMDKWDLTELRNRLSLVTQDTTLFPVTIAENISYGRQSATQSEIIAAAKAAQAHEFIMELPSGYQTVVGERGSRLSGGQKQRIAIARALIKDAPILLLDEPTSALDTQSEALVQEALEHLKSNRTVLIVAHRLTTIKNADEVIVLDEGRIVERGTHDALLAENGFYASLYRRQLAHEEQQTVSVGGT
ncbi:MAG TPA: ABC transporter ATP-binding protein [Candidatus Bathyarchaeia archaeon]|nr:ABC transporter ATP-binding protein [Candidatus Bathyarchaeia archaeon]